MKKITLLLLIYSLSYANIYEILNNFAYDKKSENIAIEKVNLVHFSYKKEKCVDFIIKDNEINILNTFNSCKNLKEDESFIHYLNQNFLPLYKQDNKFILQTIAEIQNIMRDIMVYYKIYYNLDQNMIRNNKIQILSLDKKNGGLLLYKLNQEVCVGIELGKHNEKMAMKIYGIENLEKQCHMLINSPIFKNLSYTKNDFKWYYLD